MEDLLTFLTGNLKQRGMTVNEFCEQIGISRQKFYRFVKEPRRFTADNIRAIESVLGFSEADISQLNSYLLPQTPGAAVSDRSCYNPLVAGLFSHRLSEELSVNTFNIEYNDSSVSGAMYSPDTIARILASPCRKKCGDGNAQTPANMEKQFSHEYMFTIYNCSPSGDTLSSAQYQVARNSLLTIARIILKLERSLKIPPRIHVRHYLSEPQQKKMLDEDIDNRKAMQYKLQLLNCVLPILSSVENYSIDTSETTRQYWSDHSDLCLIKHKCSPLSREADNSQDNPGAADVSTEYYTFIFSDSGECTACRLGNEEAAHIYRFFSIDIRDKESLPFPTDINQFFYEQDRISKFIKIHPDLCFDDIPREMWFALYGVYQNSQDKEFFEASFRELIDPYGQYTFLKFDEIVHAAINTLDQRYKANRRNGHITIFHPEALQNFVRTGIITDLISEESDHSGKHRSEAPLRFPSASVKALLMMIRSNIADRLASPGPDPDKYSGINYYILSPQFPYPEVSYIIYRDYGVAPIYNKGPHKNKITGLFRNAAIGTLLYNYVIRNMINDRGKDLNSGILSDEHSLALIDKLILEVEEYPS